MKIEIKMNAKFYDYLLKIYKFNLSDITYFRLGIKWL